MRGWIVAARPFFLPGALVLYGLGALLGSGPLRPLHAILGSTLVVLVHLITHFVNDAEDVTTDALSAPTLMSGGSRAIQQGLTTPARLLRASAGLGAAALVITAVAAALGDALEAALFAGMLVLGYGYSGRPLELGRRGLGELAAGVAMGVLLPLAGACAAGGITEHALAVTPFLGIATVMARLATSFPDLDADRETGKWTILALVGAPRVPLAFLVAAAAALASGWAPGAAAVPGLRAGAGITALAGVVIAGIVASGGARRAPIAVPITALASYAAVLVLLLAGQSAGASSPGSHGSDAPASVGERETTRARSA